MTIKKTKQVGVNLNGFVRLSCYASGLVSVTYISLVKSDYQSGRGNTMAFELTMRALSFKRLLLTT